jgi:(2R)-ethylmalonyl-CoA mutase
MQQVLAYETDMLEYDDLFDGSTVVETKTAELRDAAQAELDDVLALGGAFDAVDVIKARLVASMAERTRRIESGDLTVVGVNAFTEAASSPLGGRGAILTVDPGVGAEMAEDVQAWRAGRDQTAVDVALAELRRAASSSDNVMPATLTLARAGGTTGEWGDVMREVFGEYRGPTGVGGARAATTHGLAEVATRVRALPGGPVRLLVAKPGLDGHSNGAEQIALAARDAGMEVIYSGIRMTISQIAASARDEDPDVVGVSILSGSHMELVPQLVAAIRGEGVAAPVVVGGIIPEADRTRLLGCGVAAVYTPKDFELARLIADIVDLATAHRVSDTFEEGV